MKPTRTWILIADGARARILESHGRLSPLIAHSELVFSGDHSATHEIMSDKQGRSVSSHGTRHAAVESHSDPHRELKAKFAHQLAEALEQGLQQKAYDRLVIVASPVTLGDLRSAISDHVRAKVTGELAQDLTKMPNDKIVSHLTDLL
jgi:protein required for attachment to host cells